MYEELDVGELLDSSHPLRDISERIGKVGRPGAVTWKTRILLECAYKIGCSDKEASVFAEIHPSTLYRFMKKNPEFCELRQDWKRHLVIQSRIVIANAISKKMNTKVAMWYLTNKVPEEFGCTCKSKRRSTQ